MKFKDFIKEFSKRFVLGVKNGISRFSVAFICTILFFLTVSFTIIFETGSEEIIISLCMTYIMTAVLSVFLKTFQENICAKFENILQYILCFIIAVVSFVLTYIYYELSYTYMAYTGVIIALLCFTFFVLMRGENRDLAFPRIVTSSIFAFAVCAIISAGISICIGAFHFLIFSYEENFKVYVITLLLIWVVGYVNIFLSFIPKKDKPAPQSKIFRIFTLFAGLPLYMLLIAILLLYLAKIVITQNMPVGEINWFASFASLFFIFFLLSVKQYPEKLARLFVKFGGYFFIPILVMQAIAFFERINAYGLTTPRTISLILIVISILFIVGSTIAPKHINKLALASGIIVLIVTCTPFNVIDIPVASQTKILENVLVANDMLNDGKVIPNENVSEEDAEKIISSYEYLKYNAKKVPEFIPNSRISIKEIFGFEKEYDDYQSFDSIHCSYHTKDQIDIANYDEMLKVYQRDNDTIVFNHNDKEYIIDLKQLAQELHDTYETDHQEIGVYIINENVALYFNNFFFNILNNDIFYCNFDGFALLKN